MRLSITTVPAEDAGADSSYELISGTDSESLDTPSMADSVGSLRFNHPDDVHSLAGTEHTYDDDSADDDDVDDDRHPASADADDYEHSRRANDDDAAADESESDEEAHSRSSLEYTQQSLRMPSITLPEADFAYLKPEPVRDAQHPAREILRVCYNGARDWFWQAQSFVHWVYMEHFFHTLVAANACLGLAMLLSGYYTPYTGNVTPEPAAVTIATTTAVALLSSTSSATALPTASTGGVGLISLEDGHVDEWFFGGPKPVLSFTPQAQGDILVVLPNNVKKAWLTKDCLTVTASRNGEHVDTTMTSVDDGLLFKFPKKEAHGVVNLSLAATCRPRVHKSVKIHFSKNIMEEVHDMIEITKNFAQDLTVLVPAAAQEAERRFEDARRSLNTASDHLGHNVLSVSDNVIKSLSTTLAAARKSLDEKIHYNALARSTEEASQAIRALANQAAKKLPPMHDIQEQMAFGLLDAQISAKAWWLKATGKTDAHADYQRKARDFVAKKRAAACDDFKARHEDEKTQGGRVWERLLRKHKPCGGMSGRTSRRRTHQCAYTS